jgi:hypothetical protein
VTPPLAAVEKRRDLVTAIASTSLAATITAIPADFTTWVAALRARDYHAWRHPSGEVTVITSSEVGGRPVRVTAVFTSTPAFMTRDQAAALPTFDSPAPAARLTFPEAA